VDQIDLKEMILPLVVVDVHEEVAKNPDYTLLIERVQKREKDHGKIPRGRVCSNAYRLVEALAGRGKNGK
jgi:kynurenine formamidase